eukprot:TRINITY_DN2474_c0_g2_i2.p1 TRINITY_DN2474_c0_g2~~TRINITY_DN2474_c0_g2_i2.p1  ORF type:complete len:214 (+),score=50.52 TRINITY_DN2474_c0_g2_i2:130-771(+)
MILRSLCRRLNWRAPLARTFAASENNSGNGNNNSSIQVKGGATTPATSSEIPVYLRPYDATKYEVPSTKLKYASGYALLDIEPFPRSKIMKLCYLILDKIKDIPEDAMYRLYQEEKIKYIMNLTDKTEDIRELEAALGHDSVEMFIQALHSDYELVDLMKDVKPWEPRPDNDGVYKFSKVRREYEKYGKQMKPRREPSKFIANQPDHGQSTAK